MKRALLILLLLGLVACGPSGTTEPTVVEETRPTATADVLDEVANTATVAPTDLPPTDPPPTDPPPTEAPTAEVQAEPEAVEETVNVDAVAAIIPATTAAEAAEVRPQDWVKGAEDPLVTIIEYGDFQ